MDTSIRSQNENFQYDPQISGFDSTFWKTMSGAPAISSNKIRLNTAEIVSYSFYKGGVYKFAINAPVAPVAGQDKAWGLYTPSLGNKSRIEFKMLEAVFSVIFYDKDGNTAFDIPITWDAAWTATEAIYEVRIFEGGITIWINNVCKYRYMMNIAPNRKRMLEAAALHIRNSDADNLDVGYVSARAVQSLT